MDRSELSERRISLARGMQYQRLPRRRESNAYHITQSRDGYWNAVAICRKGDSRLASTRMGASTFHDKKMALAYACRNAIKWLLPQAPTGERMAYRDTRDNALERYA